MVNFHLNIFILCSIFVIVSGFSKKLQRLTFDEGYTQLFGHDNLMVLEDGNSVHISLDERTGLLLLLFLVWFVLFLSFTLFGTILFLVLGFSFLRVDNFRTQ